MNYSYSLLSQSDDEADELNSHNYCYDETSMSMSDIDEANWLLTHEGLLDTSATGRKNAKKRTQALKKKAVDKEKKGHTETKPVTSSKKKKDSKSKEKTKEKSKEKTKEKSKEAKRKEARAKEVKAKDRDREQKKEQREIEKKRRKRLREREKVLRVEARKNKRRRTSSVDSEDDERGLAHDKRARATAIVRAYLTRMAKDDQYKSLGLGGVMTIPASMVDSTGLLGMALAFRAAAGEISMPDDGEQQVAKMKPWTAIDNTKAKTSHERSEALARQATLLEEEIDRVRENTQRRKDLAREDISQRLRVENDIEADDEAARRNHFKKKKKYSPKPNGKTSPNGADENHKTTEVDADAESERPDDDENAIEADVSVQLEQDGDSVATPNDGSAMEVEEPDKTMNSDEESQDE
jgi:hypothetical protein